MHRRREHRQRKHQNAGFAKPERKVFILLLHSIFFLLHFILLNSTQLDKFAREISQSEPLLTVKVLPELIASLSKLQTKLQDPLKNTFYHYKTLKTHILPLTNVAFDKLGNK